MVPTILNSSFRDPSGFVFSKDGRLYRQVNQSYKPHYDALMNSGLYSELVKNRLLISHEEKTIQAEDDGFAYKILEPMKVPFISYPYEWCFSALKDAALTTIKIQEICLSYGMTLKDASAYNIQFLNGQPIHIDTLSFEIYKEGEPWIAYRQFCQHFLAPLLLMSKTDDRFGLLYTNFIDGIPLDLASKLLPWYTYFNIEQLIHVHLHSRAQNYYADKTKKSGDKFTLKSFYALVASLASSIKNLKFNKQKTEWSEYIDNTNYTQTARQHKKEIVDTIIKEISPDTIWDFGSNLGIFSDSVNQNGMNRILFDSDHLVVEKSYRKLKESNKTEILPLLMDICNPSHNIGFADCERDSLVKRGPADLVLALAILHHIAISNNVPFKRIAEYFSKIGNWVLIEFVPKSDSKVEKLLATRRDIFIDYTRNNFEQAFNHFFNIVRIVDILDSKRTLYLLSKK